MAEAAYCPSQSLFTCLQQHNSYLVGSQSQDVLGLQNSSFSVTNQSSLGLGSLFVSDINTIAALLIFSSQDLHVDIPLGFIFQAPPKRGCPKGSKTKKVNAPVDMADYTDDTSKMITGRSKKRGNLLISSDPVHPFGPSGSGKWLKGGSEDEVVVPELKPATAVEAVDAETHHHRDE